MNRRLFQQVRQLNNKAFSMIELLVIVAIMGVLIGVFSASYLVVEKGNVKKAVNFIDDELSVCKEKAQTNSADEWKVVIKPGRVSVVKVIDGVESEESSKAIPEKVSLYISENSGKISGTEIGSDYDSVSISFRQSGEVGDVYVSSTNTSLKGSASSIYIIARYKDKKEQNVKIYYSTGKHTVE